MSSLFGVFKAAAQELPSGALLKEASFSLEDAILAVDVMKRGLDVHAEPCGGLLRLLNVQHLYLMDEVEKAENSLQELTDKINGMFSCFVEWLSSTSVAWTILSNFYLTNHQRIKDPVLSAFSHLVGHCCGLVYSAAFSSGVITAEDLSWDTRYAGRLFSFSSEFALEEAILKDSVAIGDDPAINCCYQFFVSLCQLLNGSALAGDLSSRLKRLKSLGFGSLLGSPEKEPSDRFLRYGIFPFFDISSSMFPPKTWLFPHSEYHLGLEQLSAGTFGRFLEISSALGETFDARLLAIAIVKGGLDVPFALTLRLLLGNWIRKHVESNCLSVSSIEEDHQGAVAFYLGGLLFLLRSPSWIHRKALEFVASAIKQQSEDQRSFLLLVALRHLSAGFELDLYQAQLEAPFIRRCQLQLAAMIAAGDWGEISQVRDFLSQFLACESTSNQQGLNAGLRKSLERRCAVASVVCETISVDKFFVGP